MVAYNVTTPSSPVSIPPLEPYRPTLTVPLTTRIDAMGLTLARHPHPDSRNVWNVFHADAGWVGCLKVELARYRVVTHDGRRSDHWTILGALTALQDAANTRTEWEAL